VGPANVCNPTLGGLATNFGLQPLLGKSVAVISDARLSGRTDAAVVTERLLSISGEDQLTVDRKYLPGVTGKLPTRFVIITNELPRLADASGALAGRLILLRFTKSFYGAEDTLLTDKLLAERPGILLWALEGWRRLRERGRFVQPEASGELMQDMEDLSSPMSAFVRDCCAVGPKLSVAVDDLYLRWVWWCEQQGRKEPGTKQTFARDLRAHLPNVALRQPRVNGGRVREYLGIGLQPVEQDAWR
jgi:putative DNA primase/helicase